MYVLVEYNDLYNDNIKELKRYDYTGVVLFTIVLNNKNQIRDDLERLKKLKESMSLKFSAIRVVLEKIDNSTIGVVNNMKNYFDIVIGQGGLNKVNRFFLEQCQIDFLIDSQSSQFKNKIDFIHHFNSGLNHILCKLARERDVGFIFSFNFFNDDFRNISKEIGRINQNLKFAQKYNIDVYMNYIIKSMNQIKSLQELCGVYSFFELSSLQKKGMFSVLQNVIERKRVEKETKFISKDIQVE